MAELHLIEGPGGGGKSEIAEAEVRDDPDRILVDLTALWAALGVYTRDSDGRYPVRRAGDKALLVAAYVRMAAIGHALRQDINVTATTATPDMVERMAELARKNEAAFRVSTIDPGEAVVRERLARFGGTPDRLSDECEKVVSRWYNR